MRSSQQNLGSMKNSPGAKNGSKRTGNTKQDPNFDLPSLRDRTATVFSASFPSSISTFNHVDFSSCVHFLLLGVKVFVESEKKKLVNRKTRMFDLLQVTTTRRLICHYINFKMLSKITLLSANITSVSHLSSIIGLDVSALAAS